MTIEEEFFKTFGIEPKMLCNCEFKNLHDYRIEYGSDECDKMDSEEEKPCETCIKGIKAFPLYPEITDRKLLELICILDSFTVQSYLKKQPFDINVLKADILSRCLFLEDCGIAKDRLKQQVKALFEGEE